MPFIHKWILPSVSVRKGFLGTTTCSDPCCIFRGTRRVRHRGSPQWIRLNFTGRTLLRGPQRTRSCTITSVEERLLSWSHFLTPTHPRGGVMLMCGLEPPQLSPLPHSSEHPSSAGWGRPADTLQLHPGLSGWVQPRWGSVGCTSRLSSSSQFYPW